MIVRSLKAFGYFLVGVMLALLIVLPAQAANPFNDARAATRLLKSATVQGTCSAVVIAPEIALTAKHCTGLPDMLVDGLPAAVARTHPTEDIAQLSVPGLGCPCVQIGADRPALDETIVVVGYLYGDIKVTSRGEYLGPAISPDKEHYGLATAAVGPGMSGGGVYRVYVTGEVRLVGVLSGMSPQGNVAFYVEVSRDAAPW